MHSQWRNRMQSATSQHQSHPRGVLPRKIHFQDPRPAPPSMRTHRRLELLASTRAFAHPTPIRVSTVRSSILSASKMPLMTPTPLTPTPIFVATRRSVIPSAAIAQPASTSPPPVTAPTSSWCVHKFGGTSMGNAACIATVADIVLADVANGGKTFVVVSAVSGVTDRLMAVVDSAISRSPKGHYLEMLDKIAQTHKGLAKELLGDGDHEAFMATLRAELNDIRDLLRAVWIARSASARIRDLVAGHGELWSARLLWMTMRGRHGVACSFMDARDVLVARPSEASTQRKIAELKDSMPLLESWVKSNPTAAIVATGYVCMDKDGFPSTLGRNGSDYSAAIFANLLKARELCIWTDVDGVFSADPTVVNDAVVIKNISYKEAAELAYFGARILHPDAMSPIIASSIPMKIKNTFNREAAGTLVHASEPEQIEYDVLSVLDKGTLGVKGFTTVQDVSIVNIEGTGMIGVPGIASRVFQALHANRISVILIAQASSEYSICVVIPSMQRQTALEAARKAFRPELADGLISTISDIPDCSILAMVGEHMQQRPGVSSRLFSSLTRASVNIVAMAQGSCEHNISVVVKAESESRALRAAHAAFYLSDQTVSLGLIGPGVVGSAFLEQVHSQLQTLANKFCVDLRVRGIANARKMIFGEPVDLQTWREQLGGAEALSTDLDAFANHIQDVALPHAVICDCTASDKVSSYYAKWLKRGIHIVTPNKKANSGPQSYYNAMRSAQRFLNSHFFYEANVGAGLPIISSVRDLLRTGDEFLEIEGIFSGTLSFIFNEFDGSEPFSTVVARAKVNGYTEPDPRDDLSGMDVARKVVILAREIGIEVELSDVPVKSLVPSELAGKEVSVEEFMQRLPDYDGELTVMANEAASNGELLRYVGIINARTGRCAVELRQYKESHPFGRLQGSDNIVSFRTERYDAQPLVVQGPGAGADVTAAGVFGDLLRLAGYLGAPSTADT